MKRIFKWLASKFSNRSPILSFARRTYFETGLPAIGTVRFSQKQPLRLSGECPLFPKAAAELE